MYSDGTDEPAALVEMAVAAGLSSMALTDHDGFEGIEQARKAAAGRIGFIPGIELDRVGRAGDAPARLVGRCWVSPDRELEAIRSARELRNIEIIAVLNEMGHPITADQVQRLSEKGVIGRPHIARALMETGAVTSVAEAFDRYLGSGRPAYRPGCD